MNSAAQVQCPGCGVSISPAQGRCASCARRAHAESARNRRWALAAALLGGATLLAAGAVGVRHRQRLAEEQRPAPSILPTPEPPPARHAVQLTGTTLSLDGEQLPLEIAPLLNQYRASFAAKANDEPDAASPAALLQSALQRAYARPGFMRDRLHIDATSGVPLGVVIEVLDAAGAAGFATKSVTVPASAGLPPATLYTSARAPDETRKEALRVQFNHVSVDMVLYDSGRRHEVGEACRLDAGGLALRYVGEPEFSVALACLTTLRARLPTSEPAHARLEGRAETPIGAFVHLANALRCGEPDCPERPKRLWDEFYITTISGRLAPAVSELVARAEPSLTQCYEAHRSELGAPAYEVEGWVWFTKGKPRRVDLEPGLPAALDTCARRALEREPTADLRGADPTHAYYLQLMIHGRDWRAAW